MRISIVVPVYRSSQSLLELAERLHKTFDVLNDFEYELILVNDSPDDEATADALNTLLERDERVIVIELTRNFGQQPATLCGIEHAAGDYIVTMDDDLQHAPEDIAVLLQERRHDAVFARFEKKQHSFFNRWTSHVKARFDHWILGKPKSLQLTPFRLIKAEIASKMLLRNTPFPFIPALLFEITNDIVNVDVSHHPRAHGDTSYNFIKRLRLFTNLVINNSSLLLRLIGFSGLLFAASSFLMAAVIIARKLLFDTTVSGWASVMSTLLFFGGMVLLTMGIIGEYLIRIVATSEQRSTHHVRSVRSKSTSAS
jgi:dolichol-phosphate mannosyltransferase/undecaprenyl-phosphate 4-deoxy-4-formamido-L-arabinose transferase